MRDHTASSSSCPRSRVRWLSLAAACALLASLSVQLQAQPPPTPRIKKPSTKRPATAAATATGGQKETSADAQGPQAPSSDSRLAPVRSHLDAWETAAARRTLTPILDRGRADHLVCLGHVLFQEQKYGEALTQYRTATEIEPSDPEPWLSQGMTQLALERDAEAAGSFNRAYALARDFAAGQADSRSLYLLGVSEQRTKRYAQSLATLRQAREQAPRDAIILYQMGLTYAFQESWNEAVDFLGRALQIDSGIAYAYYYRGLSYGRLNRKDLLVTDLNRFLELAPGSPEAPRARKLVESASR